MEHTQSCTIWNTLPDISTPWHDSHYSIQIRCIIYKHYNHVVMPFTACTALQQHTVVRISKSSCCDVIARCCVCSTIAGGLPQSLRRNKMLVMLSRGSDIFPRPASMKSWITVRWLIIHIQYDWSTLPIPNQLLQFSKLQQAPSYLIMSYLLAMPVSVMIFRFRVVSLSAVTLSHVFRLSVCLCVVFSATTISRVYIRLGSITLVSTAVHF